MNVTKAYTLIKNGFFRKWKSVYNNLTLKQPVNDAYEDPGYHIINEQKFYYHHRMAFEITYSELFEKGIYAFSPKTENPIIIDCGANMGLSLLFFSKHYPTATIYAFEVDNTMLDILEKNIETFKMEQVVLYKRAVWISDGNLQFFTDGGMGGRLNYNYSNQTPITVETIRLKTFIGSKHIDLLKMDIEGAEYEILIDCESILHQVDHIFLEYHSLVDGAQNLDNILSILKRNGFRYHLTESFSRRRPFVDKELICEKMDMAINVFGYKVLA